MIKQLATIFIVLGLFNTTDVQSQSYYTRGNLETNLGPFSTINGQWIAISPSNNTLGTNYYQGLNFGFDANNYVSLVNGVGTNDLYFGRWEYAWKDWNKIWHSGNLNNSSIDFTAKILNVSKINLNAPGSSETIDAVTVDVQSFGTSVNAQRSSFFRVRDIGAGNWIPFIIKGDGNVGIGTATPSYKLDIDAGYGAKQIRWRASDGVYGYTYSDSGGIGITNGDPFSELIYLQTGNKSLNFYTNTIQRAIIDNAGNFGIGTTNPTSKLTVAGNINAREVKVTVDAGADFVFEKGYDLPSLTSLDTYIKENKHLPEIASADEMKKNGINLSEMNIRLLQKIEELTLYMIEMKKENEDMKKDILKLKQKN